MTGADAPALRALGQQLASAATQFDRVRSTVRTRLYTVDWTGPDGAQFRRDWDGRHSVMLSKVAADLRTASQALLLEAAQQEAAAESDGGRGTGGLPGSPGGARESGGTGGSGGSTPRTYEVPRWLTLSVGAVDEFLPLMIRGFGQSVDGYRAANGAWVEGYVRWQAGHADTLNWALGSTSDVAATGKVLGVVGDGLGVVGAGFAGHRQWLEDADEGYSSGEQATRAAFATGLMVAADLGGGRAGAAAGAAIGTIFAPGVGTVVGGMVGWAIASYATDKFEDQITDAGAWAGSQAYKAASDYIDLGGTLLSSGGDLLGSASGAAGAAWDKVTPW